MPKNFPASPMIKVIKVNIEGDILNFSVPAKISVGKEAVPIKSQSIKEHKERTYTVSQKRESHKDAYKPWTPELDEELKQLYQSDNPISAIADHFGRTNGAIISRLKKYNYFPD
jgi:hypothetical protein